MTLRNVRRSLFYVRSFGIACVLSLAASTTVSADLLIPAGVDCWTTAPGTTAEIGPFPVSEFTAPGRTSLAFGLTTIPVVGVPLAPGTCACTPPIIQWTDSHGTPVHPGDKHAVNQTTVPNTNDTCVRRNPGTMTALGVAVPVPIEMVALHLRGSLSVPMNTGAPCTYTVDIQLNGSQSLGSMSFTPTKLPDLSHGTINLASLPVGHQVAFTPTSGCNAHNAVALNTTFTNNSTGVYQVAGVAPVPALSTVGMAILAGALLLVAIVILRRRARLNVA